MTPLNLVLALSGLFTLLFFYGLLRPLPDPSAALRERYLSLIRMGRSEGLAHLDDRLSSLSQRYPGRTYSWYLKWLVTDLQRAKR